MISLGIITYVEIALYEKADKKKTNYKPKMYYKVFWVFAKKYKYMLFCVFMNYVVIIFLFFYFFLCVYVCLCVKYFKKSALYIFCQFKVKKIATIWRISVWIRTKNIRIFIVKNSCFCRENYLCWAWGLVVRTQLEKGKEFFPQ